MRWLLVAVLLPLAACDSVGLPGPVVTAEASEPWPEMLDAVNAVRAAPQACGSETLPAAGPLVWNDRLGTAARRHSEDMAARDRMTHVGSDGSEVGERASRAGYAWRLVGENIARYQQSVGEVVGQWMASPSHCRQIMDPRVVELGAAEHDRYWTQVFGLPR